MRKEGKKYSLLIESVLRFIQPSLPHPTLLHSTQHHPASTHLSISISFCIVLCLFFERSDQVRFSAIIILLISSLRPFPQSIFPLSATSMSSMLFLINIFRFHILFLSFPFSSVSIYIISLPPSIRCSSECLSPFFFFSSSLSELNAILLTYRSPGLQQNLEQCD